jgi:hypothetical protein
MREVLATSKRVPPWWWTNLAVQALLLGLWAWRLAQGERGAAVVLTVGFALVVVLGVLGGLVDRSSALVLTDEALVVERPWRPRRIPRAEIRAVDGDVHGRPGWSDAVVLTVGHRTVKLGGFDAHPRVLIPRLQEWAGVGGTPAGDPDEVTPRP